MPESVDLAPLFARRSEFKAFLAKRLNGSDADAEDLLQNSLTKALHDAAELKDSDKLVPWFYELLRNAIVDHVRSRQSSRQREERWTREMNIPENDDVYRQVCLCFQNLLPALKSRHAELLHRVEIENQSVAEAAHELGLTPGNASVLLHRARAELRGKLESFCGSCAENTCFDCDCGPPPQA